MDITANEGGTIRFNQASISRAAAAGEAFLGIYIPTKSHEIIQSKCELLRLKNRGRKGKAMGALRLAQLSSAGKTALIEDYISRTLSQHRLDTGEDNPNLILYVPLTSITTPKTLCREICRKLGDTNYQTGTLDDLIDRMKDLVPCCGVELIFIDEVQNLKGRQNNKKDVADLLKSLLNLGIVPLVFVGDETSGDMFNDDIHLGNRSGSKLELNPILPPSNGDVENRLPELKQFCTDLEAQMMSRNIVTRAGSINTKEGFKLLLHWSGGHLGRVCRIIAEALEHAMLRNSAAIEMQDLNHAIQNFAIPNNYHNVVRN